MVIVTDKAYHLDDRMKKGMDEAMDRVKNKNFDFRALICGHVGDGKSKLARQLAYYWAWSKKENYGVDQIYFGLDDIFFDIEEFFDRIDYYIDNNIHFRSIILDEARKYASSVRANSDFNERLKNKLAEIRKLNLFIILLAPDFFELDQGVAVKGTNIMVQVRSNRLGERGFYRVWGRRRKQKLYHKGKTMIGDYTAVRPAFKGRYFGKDVIDESEYDKKALRYAKLAGSTKGVSLRLIISVKKKIFSHMYLTSPELQRVTQKRLAEMFDIEAKTCREWLKEILRIDTSLDGKGVHETMKEFKQKAKEVDGTEYS